MPQEYDCNSSAAAKSFNFYKRIVYSKGCVLVHKLIDI